MNTYQVNNRQNGFLTTLAAAAAVALACQPPLHANSDSWLGSNGNWNTATDWSEGYLPGSQSQTGYTYPSGPWDDVVINNGGTVTINTNQNTGYPNGLNLRDFNLNDGGQSGHVGYTAGSTLTVATGGYLSFSPNQLGGGSGGGVANGYNATINITGGTLVGLGGTTFGDGIGWAAGVQNQVGTGTLNVSAGLFGTTASVNSGQTGSGLTVGNQSSGIVNLSGSGTINTGEYGAIDLGANAPASGFTAYGTGTFTQTGGTLDNGRNFIVGGSAAGYYNLSGGTAVAGTNNGTFMIGQNATGTFTMTGGTLTSSNAMQVGGGTGTGTATISGGSLALSRLVVGNSAGTGSGRLVISGTGTTGITLSAGAGSSPMQTFANGTLDFQIGSNGVRTITADGGGITSATTDGRDVVALSGTLQIDQLNGFTPAKGALYTLISTNVLSSTYSYTNSSGDTIVVTLPGIVTGAGVDIPNYNNDYSPPGLTYPDPGTYITNTGLSLAPADASNWQLLVTTLGSGTTETTVLQAEYIGPVPEPAPLTLLAAAGAGLLLLGRRRRSA